MKKILVPTDFSPYALNSFEYALQLAADIDAHITLFYSSQQTGKDDYRPQLLREALDVNDMEEAYSLFEVYGNKIRDKFANSRRDSYVK